MHPMCQECMARPCVGRRNVERANVKSCINVSDLWCGALMLRARMGIRAHPRLTKRTTSKGQAGTQSRGCAGQSVRPSPHSISQTSVGKLLNRSIFDPFKFDIHGRLREAISSEP